MEGIHIAKYITLTVQSQEVKGMSNRVFNNHHKEKNNTPDAVV